MELVGLPVMTVHDDDDRAAGAGCAIAVALIGGSALVLAAVMLAVGAYLWHAIG